MRLLMREMHDHLCESVAGMLTGPAKLSGPEAAFASEVFGDLYTRSCMTGDHSVTLDDLGTNLARYFIDRGADAVAGRTWGPILDRVFDRAHLNALTEPAKNAFNNLLLDQMAALNSASLDCFRTHEFPAWECVLVPQISDLQDRVLR
jgi:hypothetical protein